jgi:hypothetical protein
MNNTAIHQSRVYDWPRLPLERDLEVTYISDLAHAPGATPARIPKQRFCPDTEEVAFTCVTATVTATD